MSGPATATCQAFPDAIPLPEVLPTSGPFLYETSQPIPREGWVQRRRMRELAIAGAICLDLRHHWPVQLQVADWVDTDAVAFIVSTSFIGLPALLAIADFVLAPAGFVPPQFVLDPALQQKFRASTRAAMAGTTRSNREHLCLTTAACAMAFSPRQSNPHAP